IAGITANASGGGGGWLDPGEVDFHRTGLVSVFIRHRLDLVPFVGTTERNVVQIADPALKPKSRPSDRRQVRRNLEAGYAVELVPGADAGPARRAAFLDLYEQTMRRTDAAPHYFFGAEYFERLLPADRTWLALATDPEGAPAAASIAAVSDGYLHYFLSGSSDSHLGDSPMKNVLARLIELSGELALPLNLGGGLAPGDALEEFKRGFANRTVTWRTSEIVCDPKRYAELAGDREVGGFFPAYRAPR
ncbi:MAG TPA: GNAT family N-acetyltransferase, partial [Solirubrobacterales bacterium]|nr:GNAT family N-acetyltransferase [Solirubrobacterales bacterium]